MFEYLENFHPAKDLNFVVIIIAFIFCISEFVTLSPELINESPGFGVGYICGAIGVPLLCGWFCASWAIRKGRTASWGFFIGLIFSWIGLIFYWLYDRYFCEYPTPAVVTEPIPLTTADVPTEPEQPPKVE